MGGVLRKKVLIFAHIRLVLLSYAFIVTLTHRHGTHLSVLALAHLVTNYSDFTYPAQLRIVSFLFFSFLSSSVECG